ncbi:MAG: hypothetical protein KJ737_22525 [Proteobacteria bacterium]|nr:hypothetical protein [Pseudomonadota bacterium]
MDLKTVIQKSLLQPKEELGDRSTYVGASDMTCERKGCLEKLTPKKRAFKTLLRFKRGDLVVNIVKEALVKSGIIHTHS